MVYNDQRFFLKNDLMSSCDSSANMPLVIVVFGCNASGAKFE